MRNEITNLDPDWLRERYVADGLSTYEIAAMVGRNPKNVYQKLRDFGIVTRPRGRNSSKGGRDNYILQGNANPFAGRTHSEETRKILSAKASVPKPYLRGDRNGMYGMVGPLNPRYIDGSSPERQRVYATSEWKAFARKVSRRDRRVCARCQASPQGRKSVHIHHILPWAGYPALRMDLSNVVTLCRDCHDWIHSAENAAREFLPAL